MTGQRKLLAASVSGALGFLIGISLIGCGGGMEDETITTYRPAKAGEAVEAGGNGKTNGGGGGTPAKGFGTIVGVIKVDGTAPTQRVRFEKGKATANPNVCAADAPIMMQSPVIGADGGIGNVFFYLVRAPKGGKDKAAHMTPANGWINTFNNKNCTFVPQALVTMVDTDIKVTTDDGVNHNVKTVALKNDESNITLAKGGTANMSYSKAERQPVKVICDIHKWMKAYQLPVDHPYAAVTDKDGKFTIKDVPSGSHSFVVWHENFNMKYDVDVTADGEAKVEIKVPASQLAN